jgi:hypothetical protein
MPDKHPFGSLIHTASYHLIISSRAGSSDTEANSS